MFFLFQLQERANLNNENLIREIKTSVENKMLTQIGTSYMSNDAFISTFMRLKGEGLDEFSRRKIGGIEISNSFRERLERDIDGLQAALKQANERNRPVERHQENSGPSDLEKVMGVVAVVGALAGIFG